MFIIIGLGNPGEEYYQTRHSVGHMFIDWLSESMQEPGLIFRKNSSFMNLSGVSVRKDLDKFKLSAGNLIVIHDDWAFELGEFRMQFGRGANRHKGVEDVIDKLDTQEFWRVRIGIGSAVGRNENRDFVLSKFSNEEVKRLETLIVPIQRSIRQQILSD